MVNTLLKHELETWLGGRTRSWSRRLAFRWLPVSVLLELRDWLDADAFRTRA